MKLRIDEKGNSKIAIISSDELIIRDTQDALDLMVTAQYNGCNKLVLYKENIIDDFFDLKTGIAGEILQKYVNYNVKVAIVGEFYSYQSKSLNDFIYECNNGRQIFFTNSVQEAVDKLHSL